MPISRAELVFIVILVLWATLLYSDRVDMSASLLADTPSGVIDWWFKFFGF